MKIINYIILVILIFFSSSCLIPDNYPNINTHKSFNPDSLLKSENSVELIIESEFDYYLLEQNVWIKVDLINNTDSNYYVMESISPGILKFSIIEPDGNPVSSGGFTVNYVIWDPILVLKPGERYQEIISLEHYLNSQEYKIGTYKISSGFYGHENIPYLKSNTIEIEILPPKGEDKELLYLTKQSNTRLSNLLDQYCESVYAPQLYTTLIVYSNNTSDNSIFESSCNKYFEKYMNFFETWHVLTQYAIDLRDNKKLSFEEMDQIFDNLKNLNKTEKSKIIFNSFYRLTYKQIKESL